MLALKKEHPGLLLAVEVGYKFRFYGIDATHAAAALGIVAFRDRAFTVASIPSFRLGVHVRRLVAAGHKVGVVKQAETAAMKAAGLTAGGKSGTFARRLVATYTSTTLVDDDVIGESEASGGGGGGDDESTGSGGSGPKPRFIGGRRSRPVTRSEE